MQGRYIIGLDFGSDSVRCIIVDVETGREETSEVIYYKRWIKGMYCETSKNQFRQHPLDYIEGMEETINSALNKLPCSVRGEVVGIGVSTTGSTPCLVDEEGTPLALRKEFENNPNAMFLLWKDHTAVREAQEINEMAKNWGGIDYTLYEGGIYSSEWFWAKILHVLRKDKKVREKAYSCVEHCDWIPAILTGNVNPLTMKRSRCAAGHKAMWNEKWGGLPEENFLVAIDPLLKGFRKRLYKDTYTSDVKTGGLSREWAKKLGLKEGIAVAVGAFDAHIGAVGGNIKEKTLVKIIGTSSCDIIVAPYDVVGDKVISGICGQVDGSVIPGMIGIEAGQSAYGDVHAWLCNVLCWPLDAMLDDIEELDNKKEMVRKYIRENILRKLTIEAEKLNIEDTGLMALDWLNGRRTPYADQTLKGAVIGLTLGTTAPKIYRSLVEATAFGSKAINDQFINEGLKIDEIIALGGIAKKDSFVMQVASDVFNKSIKVAASDQACALGAAMFGAVAAGIYDSVQEAQEKMGCGFSNIYYPQNENVEKYRKLYKKYLFLGKNLEQQLRSL